MAPAPHVVAVVGVLLVLLAGGLASRPRRALIYFTQHPTGTSTSSRSGPPSALGHAPPPPPLDFQTLQALQALPGQDESPYGNVPPPPPPPPGPAPPYTVNPARGLTYATAPQAPPLRASYAPSPRISYGRVGVLARVGYTAPPLEVAAPALLLTNAKDGGLASGLAESPFGPYVPALPPYGASPPGLLAGPREGPREGRVFRSGAPDPARFGPALAPFGPLGPFGPPADAPASNPADQTPQRFVQSFVPPPVSPILLSRNRDSYYLDGVANYLR